MAVVGQITVQLLFYVLDFVMLPTQRRYNLQMSSDLGVANDIACCKEKVQPYNEV